MIRSSLRSGLVSMYTEAEKILDGLAEETYLSSFLESTGAEPQCLRTTHSSMYPLWSGCTTPIHVSSSTRYQWHALYEAWKLAIPSRNSPTILVFPPKGQPYTQQMDSISWIVRLRPNLLNTANTTSFYVKRYLGVSRQNTPPKSYD